MPFVEGKFFRDAHKLIRFSAEITNDIALTSRACMFEKVAVKMIIHLEEKYKIFFEVGEFRWGVSCEK